MKKLVGGYNLSPDPLLCVPYQQAWLKQPEAAFKPGLAQIYSVEDGFVVLAVLSDDHIHNSADGFNQKTWMLGDVFEFFIQTAEDVYYEIHVTPENQVLFLKWSPELFRAFGRKEVSLSTALIGDREFASSTTASDSELGYWTVRLFIPYTSLGLQREKLSETLLKVAFARYDAAPGRSPVLSATPAFPKARYHQRDAWHRISVPEVNE